MLPHESVYDRFNVQLIVPPTQEQLTLADARDHLRLIPYGSPPRHPEDNWITQNISTAREWCEGASMLSFVPQTLELRLDRFPVAPTGVNNASIGFYNPSPLLVNNGILLPFGPVVSVESVSYGNTDAMQPLDSSMYYLNVHSKPARLYMKSGVWPTMSGHDQSVVVRYQAGYSIVDASPQRFFFPAALMSAMKLVLGHLYLNREDTSEIKLETIPTGAVSLMSRYSAKIGFA